MSKLLDKQTSLWEKHQQSWRDPVQIIQQTEHMPAVDHSLLDYDTQGAWWTILKKLNIRLVISREYEHLLITLGHDGRKKQISYTSIPHPSGIAIDRKKKLIHIASTRNPNQIYTFASSSGLLDRSDIKKNKQRTQLQGLLIPTNINSYPGSLYIHDLALIENQLYANAVGHNAIVKLNPLGDYQYAWWPASCELDGRPRSEANYLQLNSIAAGKTLSDSFFTASTASPTRRRPGQIHFKVDRQGVIFSGQTRNPLCEKLTRPHSARLYKNKLWVNNSGYGEFGFVENGKFHSIITLPGWTRGLCCKNDIAFVGTSRVIPRFYRYAPGLNVKNSYCSIYAIDLKSRKILGSINWPMGNQIFAIEWVENNFTKGFPLSLCTNKTKLRDIFYAYKL